MGPPHAGELADPNRIRLRLLAASGRGSTREAPDRNDMTGEFRYLSK